MPMSERETITKALEIFRDMINDEHEEQEKPDEQECHGLDPNQLIDNLDMMARWTHEILKNNGSDELNDEGGLKYRDYEPATQTAIASAFAYARILHVLSAAIFVLHQGDISEEQFHHAIDEGMSRLEESSPFQDNNEQ
jgi:hypothetical protein